MPKSMLLLDLDSTIFAAREEAENIIYWQHSAESGEFIKLNTCIEGISFDVRIIQPMLLSDLIEYACTEHDGIMIMTSGLWDEQSVKALLGNYLDISERTTEMIKQCVFLNPPNTQQHFPHLSLSEIKNLDKKTRLDKFKSLHPEFNDTKFTFVDDHEGQLESFIDDINVLPVHATTRIDDHLYFGYNPARATDFYHHAKMALYYAKKSQQNSTSVILSKINANTLTKRSVEQNEPPNIASKKNKKRKAEKEEDTRSRKKARITLIAPPAATKEEAKPAYYLRKLRSQPKR